MGAFMSYFLVPREREMTRLLLKVVMQTTRWVADDLGLVTHDDPAARVGVLLNAARSMTELVDTGLLHTLPGAVPSGQFLGYAIADRTGRPASDIARTMLAQLCEYTLHLGDFEPALARTLNARQPRNTTKKHGTPDPGPKRCPRHVRAVSVHTLRCINMRAEQPHIELNWLGRRGGRH